MRPFAMESHYDADAGIGRSLRNTQPIMSIAMVGCGFDVLAQTSMAALRAKSLVLTDLFITLVETHCAGFSLTFVTPRNYATRSSHVSYEHPNDYAVVRALITYGVVGDYREPRIMRFDFALLYTSFADVWNAVEMLRDMLETGTWQSTQFNERTLVT